MVLTCGRVMGAVATSPQVQGAFPAPLPEQTPVGRQDSAGLERAARRTLRDQIARLERELADAFVTAYPMGGLDQPAARIAHPRLLIRDELAERLHGARVTITRRADEQAEKRLVLERMLLAPADHKFVRIARTELGEPGCGVWQVRPRLGLIGMFMGWWQVKLSSGCPLPRGRRAALWRPAVDGGDGCALRLA